MFETLNKAVAVIVMEAVMTPEFRATERSTVNLLLGRKIRHDKTTIHQEEHYGALAFFDRMSLKRVIRTMIRAGLLEVETKGRVRLIRVTGRGEDYLIHENLPVIDVLRPAGPDRTPLFYDLAMTRRQIAAERMILEDMVCADSVLDILSRKRPASLEAMENTEGIPPGFVLMYGIRFVRNILEASDPEIVS